ncbi:DNA glycosylase [Spinellus fusiger]|nr:DNA glycosylase [Spinellus fusiger]
MGDFYQSKEVETVNAQSDASSKTLEHHTIPKNTGIKEENSYKVMDAIHHLRSVDSKLAVHITEESINDLKSMLDNADAQNIFRSLTTTIIYQQLHGKAAKVICTRFVNLFKSKTDELEVGWFPTPSMVLAKTPEELKTVGLSLRKAGYIQSLATEFSKSTIDLKTLTDMSNETLSEFLCSVKGIGQWTVDMFMIFNLRRPNILPLTDLAVKKGVAKHFGLPVDAKKLPTPENMKKAAQIWEVSVVTHWILLYLTFLKIYALILMCSLTKVWLLGTYGVSLR